MLCGAREEVVVAEFDSHEAFVFVFAKIDAEAEVDSVAGDEDPSIAACEEGIDVTVWKLVGEHGIDTDQSIERGAARDGTDDAKLELRRGVDAFAEGSGEVLADGDSGGAGQVCASCGSSSPWPGEDVGVGAVGAKAFAESIPLSGCGRGLSVNCTEEGNSEKHEGDRWNGERA